MAELDAIRVLLKEQVASHKQLAEAFQAQMAALQAELQVTKKIVQAARHGGGGGDNLSLTLPRSIRLDAPTFSGTDLDSWKFAITEYFALLNTPVDQWLCVRELLVSKPTSLGDAFALAHVMEARLDDQGVNTNIIKLKSTHASQTLTKPTPRFDAPRQENPKPSLLLSPPKVGVNVGAAPLLIKWISSTERRNSSVKVVEADPNDAMESGYISIWNSLVGHSSPRSLQLWGTIVAGKWTRSVVVSLVSRVSITKSGSANS
ncbi:hypothetical protein Tco_1004657 [Tanacetum coccineum]|uniref:Uncharacterized protein n=1 Tax=Tanacetum coccineum TaxID=301880 RepID=A0ABQ5FD75_9ASTR